MDFGSIMTLAQFAEKIDTTVGNVKNWADKADVKPVHKFGNTNVYAVSDLEAAVGKFASTASALRAVGYIHPDQYKDMQDLHAAAVREMIQMQEEYNTLLANFNGVQAEYDSLSLRIDKLHALEAAGVDNWDNYDHAMSILNGEDEDSE
jgi:hypothetical protein